MNIFPYSVSWVGLVGLDGFEPSTSRLSGARSNHLSYRPLKCSLIDVSHIHPSPCCFRNWWRWWESNPWPPACRAGALPAELHPHILYEVYWVFLSVTQNRTTSELYSLSTVHFSRRLFGFCLFTNYKSSITLLLWLTFSIERRWSSRTFRYGYLVTT